MRGGGALIQYLQKKDFTNIFGLDVSEKAINLCKQKGIQNVFLMSGEKPEFGDRKFDIIIASDVLEHIKEDLRTLTDWHGLLKPEGKLIVFVPAFKFLWSVHDEVNHHYRRYSKSEFVNLLKKAGFQIERVSYWNMFLFLPISLIRIGRKNLDKGSLRKEGYLKETPAFFNQLLTALLRFENRMLQRFSFPLGSVYLL